VTGRLIDAAGRPTTGGSLTMMPGPGGGTASVPIDARTSPDGTFEFANVPAGPYVIQANRGRLNASTEGEFGAWPIAVGEHGVAGLVLQMSAGSVVAGRVTFDTSVRSTTPLPSSIELSSVAVDPDRAPPVVAVAAVGRDARFEMRGISGERRLQVRQAPAGWALKAIVLGGVDITDRPLSFGRAAQSIDVEVILTDRVNAVVGAAFDDRGRAAVGATVVLFAVQDDRWYRGSRFMRKTVTSADGAFALTGLPLGSYYVAAVARTPAGEEGWQDPEFLHAILPRASMLALGDGQTQAVNLRLVAP
jgi:hypothetical protein